MIDVYRACLSVWLTHETTLYEYRTLKPAQFTASGKRILELFAESPAPRPRFPKEFHS